MNSKQRVELLCLCPVVSADCSELDTSPSLTAHVMDNYGRCLIKIEGPHLILLIYILGFEIVCSSSFVNQLQTESHALKGISYRITKNVSQ